MIRRSLPVFVLALLIPLSPGTSLHAQESAAADLADHPARSPQSLELRSASDEDKQKVDQALPSKAVVEPKSPRRLLVTSLTMRDGKPHPGSNPSAIPVLQYALVEMGKKTGAYEAVVNNDILMLRPEKLSEFDGICFANSVGVLFDDEDLRESLLSYLADGHGFVGVHDAIATFVQYPKYDQFPAFGEMLGGTENGGHPWNQELMTIKVDDPDSPLTAMFKGGEFQINDQAFQLQEPSFRDRLHVLTSINVEKTPLPRNRRILEVRQDDMDFPVSWIKPYDEGRVFYCGLGHSSHVFQDPIVLEHLLAGIQYALGDLEADDSPDQAE